MVSVIYIYIYMCVCVCVCVLCLYLYIKLHSRRAHLVPAGLLFGSLFAC